MCSSLTARERSTRWMFGRVERMMILSPGMMTHEPSGMITSSPRMMHRIRAPLGKRKSLMGFGTTLTAAVIRGAQAFWAHAGDSRLYHAGRDDLVQVSRDHRVCPGVDRLGRADPARGFQAPPAQLSRPVPRIPPRAAARLRHPDIEARRPADTHHGRPPRSYRQGEDAFPGLLRPGLR